MRRRSDGGPARNLGPGTANRPGAAAWSCSAPAPTRSRGGRAQKLTDAPRYAELIKRTQWWGRQMLIWGVHVHVGISSAAKVMPIMTSLLNYYPHLLALSASSPWWAGRRHRLCQQPGDDVSAVADCGSAVSFSDLVGVRRLRVRPEEDRHHRPYGRNPLGHKAVAASRALSRCGSATACRTCASWPLWSR